MLEKIRGLLSVDDSRWGVLICLSLLLIIVETLNNSREVTKSLVDKSNSLQSWVDINLVWKHEGALGRGIYSSEKNAANSGSKNEYDKLVDPSLAVFTYRPMDLNRIDLDTLKVLKGVGPKIATAIITYRQKHGPFRLTRDLLEVKGIGPAKCNELCRELDVGVVNDL